MIVGRDGAPSRGLVCQGCAKGGVIVVAKKVAPVVKAARPVDFASVRNGDVT